MRDMFKVLEQIPSSRVQTKDVEALFLTLDHVH
jgi:hypothetical protein